MDWCNDQQNVNDYIRINREFDSNEINENNLQ
jgi:hypothetical protein